MSRSPEERVLVLASPREHPELFSALGQAAAYWIECADLPHLYQELEEGAAALLLADGWRSPDLARLSALLARQETWSELPVLLFAHPSEHLEADAALQLLGNVTLLEWPVRTATLVTTIQSALRSRSRQYQIRERLREGADAERKLRQGEERLRFSLEAGHLGFWQHNQLTDELICSDLLKSHFGRAPQDPLRHSEIVASVHPDDLDRVQRTIRQAIRARESYVIEYRVVWPDRSVHWVMVRGRASYDAAGQSVSTFGVTLDISQRKTAEAYQAEQSEQLRRLSEGLREAARRKDEFLAMLAHELRNPLAPVAHAVEIIRTRPGQVQAERAREVVERQLRHMNRLIEDLLDVSRINSGKITLKQERLDLVRGILAAIESQHAFIAASDHTLETVLPAEPVYADIDPVRLEQVVVNLLNNAAKYTEPGGHIRISLETTENAEAQIRVADNGIGIPSPLLAQVFDLFTQGERGLDRSQGGLGLGLTLVRNLVRLHGGSVEAHSDGPGRGSEFVVLFPLATGEPPQVAAGATAPAPAVVPHAAPSLSRAPRRLLVVDDNRDSAETLAELAEIWGFEVATAYDGHAALLRASEWEPALVFLDIGMPGLNGYEVARRLRQDVRFEKVTLVALTGYGQEKDIELSRAAGFDHHLVKPVDMVLLERLLHPPDIVSPPA